VEQRETKQRRKKKTCSSVQRRELEMLVYFIRIMKPRPHESFIYSHCLWSDTFYEIFGKSFSGGKTMQAYVFLLN
jgi:hypothetical protein